MTAGSTRGLRTLAPVLDLVLLEPSPLATVSSARLFPSLESPHRSVTVAEESEQLSPAASNLTETARAVSEALLLAVSTTATPTESASEPRLASGSARTPREVSMPPLSWEAMCRRLSLLEFSSTDLILLLECSPQFLDRAALTSTYSTCLAVEQSFYL